MIRGIPSLVFWAGVLAFLPFPSMAAGPQDGAKLFPQEAEVSVQKSGLNRLDLPPSVVLECRPDLSDLRLFDAEGKEVPYLVESGFKTSTVEASEKLAAKVLNVKREEQRREGAPPLFVESYEVEFPSSAPEIQSFALFFQTPKDDFVRSVSVEELGGASLGKGSIFRFPNSTEKLSVPLSQKSDQPLKVTLEGEGEYLEPQLFFRLSREAPTRLPQQLVIPLKEISREERGGKTLITFSRPRGLVPDRLELKTSTPIFHRSVQVQETGPSIAISTLGSGTVFRIDPEKGLENLEIGLGSARGDRLIVAVENGDSPPLQDLQVKGVLSQPMLVFSMAQGPSAAPARLLFGGGRAQLPHYDLKSLVSFEGETPSLDFSRIPNAKLGEIRPNPLYDHASPLQFALHPGALLEPRFYTHRRSLEVPASTDGLTRFQLKAEDLAVMRKDLADLRIIDSQSLQWSYLMEEGEGEESVEWKLVPRKGGKGESIYALTFPHAGLSLEGIALEIPNTFFDRSYRIVGDPGESSESVLSQGRLRRKEGESGPLYMSLNSSAFHTLELRIQDGNDAPLEIRKATSQVRVPAFYLVAPQGTYQVLLGNPKENSPQYELSQARDTVMSVSPQEGRLGPLEANPRFSTKIPLATEEGKQQVLLWAVLGVAVAALLFFSLRLARQKPSS